MKTTLTASLLLLLMVIMAASAAAPAAIDYERSLVSIFVFGDTGGWMGNGFVVGDGSWVVTTADIVIEPISDKTMLTVKYPIVVSKWTGDAYRAEVKFTDPKLNLALLKLSISGLPAAPLAGADKFEGVGAVTVGQLYSGEQVAGRRWNTMLYALSVDSSKQSSQLKVKKWMGQGAFIVEQKGVNWLYLNPNDPKEKPARAALVTREDGAVGVYCVKAIGGTDKKPVAYSQSLPSTEVIKALEKNGLDKAALQAPPKPKVEPDKVAGQGLQLIWSGLSYTILGKWAEAQKDAKSLAELRPQSAFAHVLVGVSLAGGGKFEDAIKSLDKAISLDPAAPGAYLSRGAAYASIGKKTEAEADFRKAIEQAPNDTKPLVALADLLAADKTKLNEAAGFVRKAIVLSPDNPGPRMTFALILKAQGGYEHAINEFKAILKLAPKWTLAKAALAATYEDSGDVESSEALYREMAKDDPKNPDAVFTLASFLADHDKKDEAKQLVTKVLDMKPPKELEAAAKELQKKL
ncbi:MAG: tetratricopeptide repeat protein [Armatimonadota bacterium]|nr:tetratricopeptide repeat protein [Armatimonadota bacterium]